MRFSRDGYAANCLFVYDAMYNDTNLESGGAAVSCKMLVNSYKITLCDIPYDRNYEVSLAFSFVSRCKLV